ncbi:MAG: hypothetical protein ACE5LS_08885 [Thermoplasmata archaeon]
MHLAFEVTAAILIVLPMVALAYGYRRTNSPRLLLALMAFGILQVRALSLISMHLLGVLDHELEETVNYVGDLAAMGMFALAFLYGTRWFGVRDLPNAS